MSNEHSLGTAEYELVNIPELTARLEYLHKEIGEYRRHRNIKWLQHKCQQIIDALPEVRP